MTSETTPSKFFMVSFFILCLLGNFAFVMGAQWLIGIVLDSKPKGGEFEPHQRHWVVSLSKNINPSLVLVQCSFSVRLGV